MLREVCRRVMAGSLDSTVFDAVIGKKNVGGIQKSWVAVLGYVVQMVEIWSSIGGALWHTSST